MVESPDILDDDSLSISSTVPSEPRLEYPLEAILAERDIDGIKKYLVKWEGYPDERCTWETESNFQDDRTLREWGLQKLRISKGITEPYDVYALETRVENWITETEARKARRRAKRLRLGLFVAPEDPQEPEYEEPEEDDANSSSDAMEYEYTHLTSPKRFDGQARPRTESSRSTVVKSENEDEEYEPNSRPHSKAASSNHRKHRTLDTYKGTAARHSSTEEPRIKSSKPQSAAKSHTKNRMASTAHKEIEDESSTEEPLMRVFATKALTKEAGNEQAIFPLRKDTSKSLTCTQHSETLPRSGSDKTQPISKPLSKPLTSPATTFPSSKAPLHEKRDTANQQLGRTGRGPARMVQVSKSAASKKKPQVTGAAILGNWDSNCKKRKSMQMPQSREVADYGNSKTFGKLSIKRRYEKAGRFEPAPNPDQLIFVDIKDGKTVKKPSLLIPTPTPKTPFQIIQENLAKAKASTAKVPEQADTSQAAVEDGNAMFMDVQVDSPGTIATEPLNRLETMNDVLHSPKLSTAVDSMPESRLVAPVEQSDDAMTGVSYSLSIDTILPSLGTLSGPDVASLGRPPVSIPNDPSSDPAKVPREAQHGNHKMPPGPFSASMNTVMTALSKDPQHDNLKRSSVSFPESVGGLEQSSRDYTERSNPSYAGVPSCMTQRRDLPEQTFRSAPSFTDRTTSEVYFQHPIPPVSLHRLQGDEGFQSGYQNIHPGQRNHIENMSDIYGTIFVGTGQKQKKIGDVRFRGLSTAAKPLFMTIKVPPREMFVRCEQICTAEDYWSYFHADDEGIYYGAGHVVPWASTYDALYSAAQTLKFFDACGVFFAEKFTLLAYPAGHASWRAFDDRFPPDSPHTSLRFIMRAAIPELFTSSPATKGPPSTALIMEGEKAPNTLFRQYFGIEYSALLPGGRSKAIGESSQDAFFLLYPPNFAEECGVLFRWLQANEAKVLTSNNAGDWDKFAASVNAGVVLIHESFEKIHLIPHLAHVLQKPINLFFIRIRPQIPPKTDVPLLPSTITRLFPHGAGILLTDSLILNHPQAVARILAWFRVNILVSKPYGTWRIVTRPRPRSWILDMVQERPKAEGRLFLEIYEQLWHILPLDLMDEDDDFETPLEDAPIQCSVGIDDYKQGVGLGVEKHDKKGLAENDNRLVEWFAGWSRTKVEYHRKFHIVHGLGDEGHNIRKQWAKRWSYILPLSLDSFMKVHAIEKWEVHDKANAEAKLKEKERLREAREQAKQKEGRKDRRPSFSSGVMPG